MRNPVEEDFPDGSNVSKDSSVRERRIILLQQIIMLPASVQPSPKLKLPMVVQSSSFNQKTNILIQVEMSPVDFLTQCTWPT